MAIDTKMQSSALGDVVIAARDLVPLIVARRVESERIRHLSPDVVEALAAGQLLQLYLPRSMGGPELAPLVVFRAIEELSRADGAVGWCAMISSSLSLAMGWLPAQIGREMCGQPADFRAAGSLRAQGHAHKVDGGYRVRGRWNFASGVDHAKWLNCRCIVMDGDIPQLTAAGTPLEMALWLPSDAATIQDTWSVIGMRGTGSNDFAVDDCFVPAAYACFLHKQPHETGLLYHPRLSLTLIWTATAANALGIARGTLDSFIEMASQASSTSSTAVLRDRPLVQARVAEAEAVLSAARAYVFDAVGAAWEAIGNNVPDPSDAIANARLAIVHAMHEAVRSVDMVFHAAGTNAIYSENPLERHFRDIHVAVQHSAALHVHYESAGKVLMGLHPAEPGW